MTTVAVANRSERGAAAGELRRHNLSVVLEQVHRHGPMSRSQLTARTGLNRSTVGDLIADLVERGLVAETSARPSGGRGRPSPTVRARAEGAVALALELTVDSVAAATVGLGGDVIGHDRRDRARDSASPEATAHVVAEIARPLLSELSDAHTLIGVGAAVAGVTSRADGVVHLGPNLGWHEAPIADLLAGELGLPAPVQVGNEADFGALGEHRRGAGRGLTHMIYVSGEVGIGSGVIHDGKPLVGAAGFGSEAGHMLINPVGAHCRCGGRGCWETEAGEDALLGRSSLAADLHGADAVNEIVRLVEAGDATTAEALDETGRWLGRGIASLINLFNPQAVVLGGLYQRVYEYLEPSLVVASTDTALAPHRAIADITAANLGQDAPLVGAAEHVFDQLIADPTTVPR